MAGLPHATVDQATGQASSNHPINNVITLISIFLSTYLIPT
ncbi:unnamed protein product, partial [Brassica oleracea]